jgi:ribonuclease-3
MSMNLDKLIVSNLSSSVTPPNLFGNALEALTGALFIDTGYTRTRRFFIEKVLKKYLNLDELLASETDYKSLILEYCQKNKLKLHYTFMENAVQSNSHPVFTVTLEINDETVAQGEGATKKEAEQEASLIAWNKTRTVQI